MLMGGRAAWIRWAASWQRGQRLLSSALNNTELLYAQSNPGQDPRHVDLIWPLWNLFDLTPEGRGTKWNPRLAYTEA